MSSFKTMLFGETKPQAVKWLGMSQDERLEKAQMFVHSEAGQKVLSPLGESEVNIISIFGAARQGKSFLMNLLANQQDLFKISNLREPCTQGVDLSAHFVPLEQFSTFNGCSKVSTESGKSIQIGFVDAEGQGDRDITYDSRLVSPILLASKVVIFNWKDSLQADRILNLLAVLARAAQGIEVDKGRGKKVFGHLHIVFRDWSFVDSTPKEVYHDLFKQENGRAEEMNVRNMARINLIEAFESINVWLFPVPVENTAILREKIRFDQLQRPFQQRLREFRTCLSTQLRRPMLFGQKPVTARLLSQIVPLLVENLNGEEVIMPESIYSSLVRAEAKGIKDNCETTITAHCEAISIEEVLPSAELDKMLRNDIHLMIAEALQMIGSAPQSVKKEMETSLWSFAEKEIRLALHSNNEKISQKVSALVNEVFQNLQKDCKYIEEDLIPMNESLLKKKCTNLLTREMHRVNSLPIASSSAILKQELERVNQHAHILFEKLEVANARALQKVNAVMNEHVRAAKANMTKRIHDSLEKKFISRQPFTVTSFQSELEDLYRDAIRLLKKEAGPKANVSSDFIEELEAHKTQLAEDLNRRYLLEMRQILNEVGFAAKEDLTKEIGKRLDGKLPTDNEDIKKQIDDALQALKVNISQQLQGWTILKSDIALKSVELEKMGDLHAENYLEQNSKMKRELQARFEQQQYLNIKNELDEKFRHELNKLELPVDDSTINTIFADLVKSQASKLMAMALDDYNHDEAKLSEKIASDCRSTLQSQKELNRLANERRKALKEAEHEKRRCEQEQAVARQKDAEMKQLMSEAEKFKLDIEEESSRLRSKLRQEAEESRKLRREIEQMHLKSASVEASKSATANKIISEINEKVETFETSPNTIAESNDCEKIQLRSKKRKVDEDVEMDSSLECAVETKKSPFKSKTRSSTTQSKGPSRASPNSKTAKSGASPANKRTSLAEARKAAQLEVQSRTQARANTLSASAKKRKK